MDIVDKLQSTFNSLGANNVESLKEVYSENIIFEDPAHQIIGLDNFMLYCHNLYKNVSKCKFEFIHVSKLDGGGIFRVEDASDSSAAEQG